MSDNEADDNPMDTEESSTAQSQSLPPQRTHIVVKSELFTDGLSIPISEFQYLRTVSQLKTYIDRNDVAASNTDLRYYVVRIKTYTDNEFANLSDDDIIDVSEIQGIVLSLKQVTFNIIDRSERYEQQTLPVTSTVQDVRQLIPYDKQQQIQYFTYKGQRVENTDTLYNINIQSGELYDDIDNTLFSYDNINWSTCLVGMIRLYIKDDLAQLETAIDTYDNNDITQIIQLYQLAARRTLLSGSTMIAQGDVTPLIQGKTLYQQHIVDETVLILTTPEYTVNISESIPSTQPGQSASTQLKITNLTVYDYYTVRRLKEEYNKVNAGLVDALTSNDKLFYANDEIDDSRKLYTYSIKPVITVQGTIDTPTILLRREEIKMNVAIYICANCGNDVALKRIDAVQCQSCFERILYKKPKPTPRQYICR